MRTKSALNKLLWLIPVFALILVLERIGTFTPLENSISERRMAASQRSATGNVVYLGIDKNTLDQMGAWPWKRSSYARIVDNLVAAGSADIFIDVDFSAPSEPQHDARFAKSLGDAGGSVILPTFAQNAFSTNETDKIEFNRPIENLAAEAWPALVNVIPDEDGVVRNYLHGLDVEGEDTPAAAALLSGVLGDAGTNYPINFSLDPKTVPTYSLIDLLNGKISSEELNGKQIVVGAHAVELRDTFTVPVHGLMSGSMLQIVASETLAQGLVPVQLQTIPPLIVLALLSFLVLAQRTVRGLVAKLGGLMLLSATTEFFGFWLFQTHSLMLPTAPIHCFLFLGGANYTLQEVDLGHWLLRLERAEKKNSRLILKQIINDSSDAILVLDEDCMVLEASGNARLMIDGQMNDLKAQPICEFLPDDIARDAVAALTEIKANCWIDRGRRETKLVSADNEVRVVQYSITPSALVSADERNARQDAQRYVLNIVARDVTAEREQQEQIEFLSYYDELTGAFRRHAFLEELSAHDISSLSIVAINLHRFKSVNTVLGRLFGDQLLRQVVERMRLVCPDGALVGRLGSDNFVVGLPNADDIHSISNAIVASLNKPFEILGSTARIGAHLGVSIGSDKDMIGASDLLQHSEIALDEARKLNGNATRFYDPSSASKLKQSNLIEGELWKAISANQIEVAYQPQVRLGDEKLVGVEALVRWRHPELGVVSPADFVEIAEANGFVEELGRWVLNKACTDASHWEDNVSVAVNVAPLQFMRSDVVADVRNALATSGLSANRLHVEITESCFLEGTDDLIETLKELRSMGIQLALDDFGTGYSSFGYLSKFALDKIKVDQMFIRTLTTDSASQAVVQSVKTLTDGLGIKMICEGVETQEQVMFLKLLGCEQAQGYYYGKPQLAEQIGKQSNLAKIA